MNFSRNLLKISGSFSLLFLLSFTINAVPAFADSVQVNFESPTYTTGSINGQDGWKSLGSVGSGCAVYDHAVATQNLFPSFDGQSLRISNAVTSGCFGDQTFAKPLTDSVGEADATAGTFSVGNEQRHFEMQFDIASTVPNAQQTGLQMSVSPDRGDGSRMSYLRFEDGTDGIDIYFDDVQGTTNPANFVETEVASGLDRSVPHTVKLTMDVYDGPSNDVVNVYIDGVLKHTGTSWENYYRYDSESSAEQSPRIVKTVIFRSAGTAAPANAGHGFLIDNLSLESGPIPAPVPPSFDNAAQANGKAKTTLSWSHTTTTQSDRLLVVGVSTDGPSVSSVTYGSQTLTRLSSKICPTSYTCNDEMWYLLNPDTGTHTITVTNAASANTVGGSVSFYTVDQTNPFGSTVVANGKGTNVSVNLTTTAIQTVIDALAGNGNASWKNDASQTLRWGNNTLNDGKGSTKPGVAGTTNMKWTNSQTDDWAEIAVPVNGEVSSSSVTPTPTPTQAPTPVTLSSLSVKDSANASDWSIKSNIQIGNTLYGDRTYTIATLPSQLAGSAWIRTANDSKGYTNDPLVTFSIDQQATVYIPFDTRASLPAWMDSSWIDTGMQMKDNESTAVTYEIYKKVFSTGTVSLGHNSDTTTNRSMYGIIVQ